MSDVASLQAALDAAVARERTAAIRLKVYAALAKNRALPIAFDLLPDRLTARVHADASTGALTVKTAAGAPMTGNGMDGLATLDDLIAEARGQFPSLFERPAPDPSSGALNRKAKRNQQVGASETPLASGRVTSG